MLNEINKRNGVKANYDLGGEKPAAHLVAAIDLLAGVW
jgi:hypothetical protein